MPSAAYFRRQADICLRLSLISSDEEVSSRLIAMARDYMATGNALARGPENEGMRTADQGLSPAGASIVQDPAASSQTG